MTAPPPKPPDRHYDFGRMNLAFAVCSLIFLAVTLWMIFEDYAKPWKRLQSEFRGRELALVEAEAESERGRLDAEAVEQMRAEIAAEEELLGGQRAEIEKLDDQTVRLSKKIYAADAELRTTKSLLDTARYEYEAALGAAHGEEAAADAERETVEELEGELRQNRITLETLQEELAAVEAEARDKRGGLTEAERRLAAMRKGLENLEERAANLEKGIPYFALNLPLLDFFEPTLKVEQVILPELYQDIHFTEAQRVDRCMTCHVAADRRDFDGEEWEEPFRSHPRLDLYVGATSPHPYTRFGCTACHGGLDRATDFARAGHTPTSPEQKAEWVEKWGWEKQKYLETPILPAGMAETGCLSCHADGVWTGATTHQDVGRELMLKMGCNVCHLIDYPMFRDLPRPGPDLRKVASKTSPEWAQRWVAAPRDFHPTTWMPHFFFQENTTSERNLARQEAEVAATVAYIWNKSEVVDYPDPPAGDPARGQQLFESVGCTGCHLLDADATRDQFFPEINRMHGPNLIRTGSKVDPGWLYAWILDPKQFSPNTRMPSLRLTESEAADITAYLMASRDPAYEDLGRLDVQSDVRDELVLDYLRNTQTIEGSEASLAEMSEDERDVYLGFMTIRKYGCWGCHELVGFEDAKPIGVELTEEGSKPLHQFDFGHVHEVEHTRHDWIRTKMLNPRIWDRGKEPIKSYGELYKMPNFGMSEREAEAIVVNVLGFTKESVRAARKAGQSAETGDIAEGRKLVTLYNCQGCHVVEGKGRAIRTAIEDVGMLPPDLAAEGARVQADWLFDYLHDPSSVTMRPWLSVRMPTFGFDDRKVNDIIGYFIARDGRQSFQSPLEPADERERAVGREVFNMLQCAKCHPAGPDASGAVGGASAADLAPALTMASDRLRHDWVPSWIRDPEEWVKGTRMPSNFARQENGEYQSPLVMAIDSPMFSAEKARMMRHFDSDEELKDYLADVDRVTVALRDHIWWSVSR
jgi:cbb3-type cytochrome oxidase cytochrome c subunit